jgi:hypothetical protein
VGKGVGCVVKSKDDVEEGQEEGAYEDNGG